MNFILKLKYRSSFQESVDCGTSTDVASFHVHLFRFMGPARAKLTLGQTRFKAFPDKMRFATGQTPA
jgi:hypothetical protein